MHRFASLALLATLACRGADPGPAAGDDTCPPPGPPTDTEEPTTPPPIDTAEPTDTAEPEPECEPILPATSPEGTWLRLSPSEDGMVASQWTFHADGTGLISYEIGRETYEIATTWTLVDDGRFELTTDDCAEVGEYLFLASSEYLQLIAMRDPCADRALVAGMWFSGANR